MNNTLMIPKIVLSFFHGAQLWCLEWGEEVSLLACCLLHRTLLLYSKSWSNAEIWVIRSLIKSNIEPSYYLGGSLVLMQKPEYKASNFHKTTYYKNHTWYCRAAGFLYSSGGYIGLKGGRELLIILSQVQSIDLI